MIQAIVAVLPVPVAPRSVWKRSPEETDAASSSIARGWSPVGRYSDVTRSSGTSRRLAERNGRSARPSARLADRRRVAVELLAGSRLGPVARDLERVSREARHDEKMRVEDVLSGALPVREEEVH